MKTKLFLSLFVLLIFSITFDSSISTANNNESKKPDGFKVTVFVDNLPLGQNFSNGKIVLSGSGDFDPIESTLYYSVNTQEFNFTVFDEFTGSLNATLSFKLNGCNYSGSASIFDSFLYGNEYIIYIESYSIVNCF